MTKYFASCILSSEKLTCSCASIKNDSSLLTIRCVIYYRNLLPMPLRYSQSSWSYKLQISWMNYLKIIKLPTLVVQQFVTCQFIDINNNYNWHVRAINTTIIISIINSQLNNHHIYKYGYYHTRLLIDTVTSDF